MRISFVFFFACMSLTTAHAANAPKGMILIEGGKFRPFSSVVSQSKDPKPKPSVAVHSFLIDQNLVTHSDYLTFIDKNPDWRKTHIKPIFGDAHYLQNWNGDLSFNKTDTDKPVVFVSWFAANAYCEWLGKRLPTTDEWEFALFDKGRDQDKLQKKILNWYSQPTDSISATTHSKNGLGISDLGYVVWEWTQDFNSFLIASDSRENSGKDSELFCGSASQMGNPSDYAAYMRYSMRSSLKANYTTANLGFRCAKEE